MPNNRRTTDFLDALKNGTEYWAPMRDGSKIFDVISKDGKPVRVSTILDDTKSSGDFIGCLVEDFEVCHTQLVHLEPHVIMEAIANKRYVILDRSPRFVLPE